jgi:4-hydroxybenzoate polyprenyltransferase
MELKNLNKVNQFILLLRPKHWLKNLLIFLPAILAGSILHKENLWVGLYGFISFSLMASAGYVFNDIRDVDKDRLHPVKRNRPLAHATIKVRYAFAVAFLLIIVGFGISSLLGLNALGILLFYFMLNWTYSINIKSVRFLDIIVLTSFYIIRIVYGAVITNTELTGWFLVTVTFACLALSLNKRQMECSISIKEKIPGRHYTKGDVTLLQALAVGFGISSIVFLNIHSYFVLMVKSPLVMVTINLMATYLIMLYSDTSKDKSDDPVERIIKNPVSLLMILALLLLYLYEIFLNK